jgi:ArsR family transcriptional regulator
VSPLGGDDLQALKAHSNEAAELLRLLANPTRLLLLCHIARNECSVAELERDLGLRQPGLSQQLAELRQNKLVKTRRESRSVYYTIADERVRVLLAALHGAFCGDPPPALSERQTRATHAAAPAARGDSARFAQVRR